MKFFTIDDVNSQTILVLSFLIVLLIGALIAVFYHTLPSQVPLLYSKPWGEEQLVQTPFLFAIPGVTLLLIFINFLFIGLYGKTDSQRSSTAAKREQSILITRMFAASILLIALLGAIGVIRILFLV